jgi:hypothetical protein
VSGEWIVKPLKTEEGHTITSQVTPLLFMRDESLFILGTDAPGSSTFFKAEWKAPLVDADETGKLIFFVD